MINSSWSVSRKFDTQFKFLRLKLNLFIRKEDINERNELLIFLLTSFVTKINFS